MTTIHRLSGTPSQTGLHRTGGTPPRSGMMNRSVSTPAMAGLAARTPLAFDRPTTKSSALGASAAFVLRKGGGVGLSSSGSTGVLLEQARRAPAAGRGAKLTIAVEAEFDIACWVSLQEGDLEGQDLPMILSAGCSQSAAYTGSADGIQGSLVIEGFEEGLGFRVHPSSGFGGSKSNYVSQEGKLRASIISLAPSSGQSDTPTLPASAQDARGIVVDLRISKDSPARLSVQIRRASELELYQRSRVSAGDSSSSRTPLSQ